MNLSYLTYFCHFHVKNDTYKSSIEISSKFRTKIFTLQQKILFKNFNLTYNCQTDLYTDTKELSWWQSLYTSSCSCHVFSCQDVCGQSGRQTTLVWTTSRQGWIFDEISSNFLGIFSLWLVVDGHVLFLEIHWICEGKWEKEEIWINLKDEQNVKIGNMAIFDKIYFYFISSSENSVYVTIFL